MKRNKYQIIEPITRTIKFVRFSCKHGVSPLFSIISALLSIAAAFFEGASAALMIPVMKGALTRDYTFAQNYPIIRDLIPMMTGFVTERAAVFILLVGGVFFTLIFKGGLEYAAQLSVLYQGQKIVRDLRVLFLKRFLSFGKMFFDRNSKGNLQQVFGSAQLVLVMFSNIQQIFTKLLMLLAYIVLMANISWALLLFVLCGMPIAYFFVHSLLQGIKKMSRMAIESRKKLYSGFFNVLSCVSLVQAYVMEEGEIKEFEKKCNIVGWKEFDIQKKSRAFPVFQEIITFSALIVLISIAAFFYTTNKAVELSSLLVFFYLVKRSVESFNSIGIIRSNFAEQTGKVEEFLEMLNDKDKYIISDGKNEFKGFQKNIIFNHLSFAYSNEALVLNDINFSIEKGKMTAIVGPTGSGKTTVTSILLRFYDCDPQLVKIDGADIRDFTLVSLRRHIALVSQENFIFNDSIKNNICYGSFVEDRQLEEVIQKAQLDELIQSLPDGVDTIVGDQGVQLSGGEKQRICIARAMLKDAEILILDEATSSLDTRTEQKIQAAIDEAVKGRTVIVIAHRLSTIKHADKIVVMDKGKVVEQGSLDELLVKKGLFYQMWEAQRFD